MADARSFTCEAIVLRTIRYGESDLIAHLLTRDHGQVSVIAKGARSARSRLGVRLEPASIVEAVVRAGKGDLGIVASLHLVRSFATIRASWDRQRVIAPVLAMLAKIADDTPANEASFHLTWRLLDAANRAELAPSVDEALIRAWELKLLHLAGSTPQFSACVRCGATDRVTAFSSRDGGVICADDETAQDRPINQDVYEAAGHLLQTSLAEIADGPALGAATIAQVRDVVTRPMLTDSFGLAPDAVSPSR